MISQFLPLKQEPSVQMDHRFSKETRLINNILIIDDDEFWLKSLELELMHRNFVVYLSNGTNSLDEYQDKKIDLILCDIHMDVKSGFDLLQEIHVNERYSMVPFILMSGLVDTFVVRRAMWLGAEDILEKPFDVEDLINVFYAQEERLMRIKKYAEERLDTLRESIQKVFPSELYNPLHIISGNSFILTELTKDIDQHKLKRIGSSISKGASQLQAIFEKISIYTYLLTHQNVIAKFSKEKLQYDAGLLIESVARNTARKYVREHCLTTTIDLDSNICISAEYLEKVISEVVDNALKFSPEDSLISLQVKCEGPVVRITVKDNGCGMSQPQLEEIGQFMQFNKKSMQQHGMGLGLSLIKLIVDVHAGIITFDSSMNNGTTVSILIPLLSKDRPEELRSVKHNRME